MVETFSEIAKNEPGSWSDPRTISIGTAKRPIKIEHIIVINNTSPNKKD